MKHYRLYGELDGSPIAMQSNHLYMLTAEVEWLKTIANTTLWYSIYRRKKDWTETLEVSND